MPNDVKVDDILGFEPNQLDVFKAPQSYEDPTIYKTTPKLSKSEDGHYHSKVKIILNPFDPKKSIVPVTTYWIDSIDGKRLVKSKLSNGDTSCPVFQCWKRNWYKADDERKAVLKELFQRSESRWTIVQVLEDNNQPEKVGKFMYMKLSKDVFDKLSDGMNPSPESGKKSYVMTDFLIGRVLVNDITPGPKDAQNPLREQREISYSLCNFEDYSPIIGCDGEEVFADEEIELIDNYYTAFNDSRNGKTQKKKDEAAAKLEAMRADIKKLYQKAIDYVVAHLVKEDGTPMDLVADMGYKEWDEGATRIVEDFCKVIDDGGDPRKTSVMFSKGVTPPELKEEDVTEHDKETDDLPF